MKNPRNVPAESAGLARGWTQFWFTPSDPVGLHVLRVLAGLVFLAWLLPLAGSLDSLFGLQGWFDQQAYADAARLEEPPDFGWSALFLAGGDPMRLKVMFWSSIGILALFTLGVCTRVSAVLTWVVVASFAGRPIIETDADPLLVILAFYLMIGYLLLGQGGGRPSLVGRFLGSRESWLLGGSSSGGRRPSLAANLAVRLLQVHFAIMVVSTGFHKLQFGDWWYGSPYWFLLYPAFETGIHEVRAHAPHGSAYMGWLSLAAYLTLAWQIGFPFFAWRRRWRPLLLAGALIGWLGAAYLYRIPTLGPAFFIGCLSYLTAEEWARALTGAAWIPGFGRLAAADAPTIEALPRREPATTPVAS